MLFRNKRGADSTMGPMIWLIVILVVAALVIFFVAGGFERVAQIFEQSPGSLEQAIQICNNIQTPATFCDQVRYVDINGEGQYVNCLFPDIRNRLDITSDPDCKIPNSAATGSNDILVDKTDYDSWGKYFCAGLVKQGKVKSSTKANGLVCADLSCNDIGGMPSLTSECDSGSKAYTKGFNVPTNEGAMKYCCL